MNDAAVPMEQPKNESPWGAPTWGSDVLDRHRTTLGGCAAVEVLCFYQTLVDLGVDKSAAAGMTSAWICSR